MIVAYKAGAPVYAYPGECIALASAYTLTAVLADITGLSWALKSGVKHRFLLEFAVSKVTSTGTVTINAGFSTTATLFRQSFISTATNANVTGTTLGTGLTLPSLTSGTTVPFTFFGEITPSADGTFTFQANYGVDGGTIVAGSVGSVSAAA
jgi:polyferredoxin